MKYNTTKEAFDDLRNKIEIVKFNIIQLIIKLLN